MRALGCIGNSSDICHFRHQIFGSEKLLCLFFSLSAVCHVPIYSSATCISKCVKGSSKHGLKCKNLLQGISVSCGTTDKEAELICGRMCCIRIILLKLTLKRVTVILKTSLTNLSSMLNSYQATPEGSNAKDFNWLIKHSKELDFYLML